jgi:hypothetical protein
VLFGAAVPINFTLYKVRAARRGGDTQRVRQIVWSAETRGPADPTPPLNPNTDLNPNRQSHSEFDLDRDAHSDFDFEAEADEETAIARFFSAETARGAAD